LSGGVRTIQKNTETFASKETGLEVNADKTKYMVMSRVQMQRKLKHKSKNCSFERMKGFKYLGTTLMDQNSIQEEIKRRCTRIIRECLLSFGAELYLFQFVIQK
jgi:hypothetical protein